MIRKNLKKTTALTLALLMAAGSFAGCGSDDTGSSSDSGSAEESQDTAANEEEGQESAAADASVPAFEDIEFPDSMPSNPTMAEESYYDYDDMSQHYEITMMTYNYGYSLPEDDPIKAWLEEKYNVTLTLETVAQSDMETALSTAFASGDVWDVITLPLTNGKDYGFTLGEQGLLVDASQLYPYMPQTCKFVTKDLLQYSTMEDGTIPFTTKYAVQDGDIWNYAIRQDWLDALGMDVPTTQEELMEFARACTFDDPDGNGQDDTYFMVAAGAGANMGMFTDMKGWFGNPAMTVDDDGVLSVPMLNGTTRSYLELLNAFYEEGVLPTDWYSIDWESSKSYFLNDRVGMVRYPAKNLFEEYVNYQNGDYSKVSNWTYLTQLPIEGAKAAAGGNAGNLFAVTAANVEGDQGKLMRICHILDAMCYGGEAYFQTVQGGGLDVYPDYDGDVREYTDDGYSICYVNPNEHPGYTEYGSDNLALAPWQNFGYTLKWQKEYSDEEEKQGYVDAINNTTEEMATLDRWPNSALLYTSPSDVTATLTEYENAQEFQFVVGERSFDDWDTYVQEWLDQGGRETIISVAEQLDAEVPEGVE